MKATFQTFKRVALLTACFLCVATVGAAELVGLPVGAKAQAFSLNDQNGNIVELDTLTKKGPVALVFFRSADW